MKKKEIQQIEVYFVGAPHLPQWFWIESFTNFNEQWIWAFDGEADSFSPFCKINTDNILYIYFKDKFKEYEINNLEGKNEIPKNSL